MVLLGDFNLPGIDWTTLEPFGPDRHMSELLLHIAFQFDLIQKVTEPTRTCSSRTILDLVFVSSCIHDSEVEVVDGVSDHHAVLLHYYDNTSAQVKHQDIVL